MKSIIINTSENATKWQVFTEKNWHGATVMLREGRRYATLDAMGLGNLVKSVRKFAAGQTVRFIFDYGLMHVIKQTEIARYMYV